MTTQTEALKLALEALKDAARHLHPAPKQNEAITAIKEVLAQPEQDTCKGCNGNGVVGNILDTDTCPFCNGSGIEAQPEQRSVSEHLEPVASDGYVFVAIPVLEKLGIDKAVIATIATTPPQRTAAEGEDTCRAWVGLTDEEMRLIDPDGFEDNLPQMIQQALKEKNTRNGGCL